MTRLFGFGPIFPGARLPVGRSSLTLLCLCTAIALAACASPIARQELLNQSQAQVQQLRGTPLAMYEVDGRTRWFYPDANRDDSARELLVFDTAGLLVEQRPAWTRDAFQQIALEQDGHLQILQAFGPPLRQGILPRSLLRAATDQDHTASDAPPDAPYWLYAFREHHLDFNVQILFGTDGKVDEVRIFQDPATDRLLSP